MKMHFDPFPGALTMLIELADAPDPLPARWRRKGHDAAYLHAHLYSCRDVRAEGAPPSNGCFVNLTPVDEDMRLSLWADGFELELTSESVSMMVRSFSRGDPSTIGR